MEYVYCGSIGIGGSPRFITHGSGGATTTAKNIMKSVSHLSKKVNL